jgi:hypothetical protein
VLRRSTVLAAGFAALAGLVAAGSANGLDRWAVDHAMPGARFSHRKPTLAEALVPLLHVRWHGAVHVLAEVVTLPAAFLPSLVLVAFVVWRTRAYFWAWLWIAGNAVKELCKSTLTRPALYHGGLHLRAFDSSYPSGHTLARFSSPRWCRRRDRGRSRQPSCSRSAASTSRPTSPAGCCSR